MTTAPTLIDLLEAHLAEKYPDMPEAHRRAILAAEGRSASGMTEREEAVLHAMARGIAAVVKATYDDHRQRGMHDGRDDEQCHLEAVRIVAAGIFAGLAGGDATKTPARMAGDVATQLRRHRQLHEDGYLPVSTIFDDTA